ncbi:Orotidine 5'-phosphate decarboxylase [Quillaja saponaria]|nr:Orotidine 5'-phosphate decarboxylase [Quillaja saponaria]
MLMVHAPGAIIKFQPYLNSRSVQHVSPCKITHVDSSISNPTSNSLLNGPDGNELHKKSIYSWKGYKKHSHYILRQVASTKWLIRGSISSDDEYRSSRNIAISSFKRYRNFIDRGGGDNLKEFIGAGVNAYALGCTDEGLRKELNDVKDSGIEIEAMQNYGGRTSLKSKIISEEVDECILWLSIIFITILCTPQPTIVRWSSTPPVSYEVRLQWKGFCALIANAYYVKGMAWLPVKTLQLEQMAVVGRAEEPSVVASRMRLVFSTLEVVSPQWPKV